MGDPTAETFAPGRGLLKDLEAMASLPECPEEAAKELRPPRGSPLGDYRRAIDIADFWCGWMGHEWYARAYQRQGREAREEEFPNGGGAPTGDIARRGWEVALERFGAKAPRYNGGKGGRGNRGGSGNVQRITHSGRTILYEIFPTRGKSVKMEVVGKKVEVRVPRGAPRAAVDDHVRRILKSKAEYVLGVQDWEEERFAPGQTLPLLGSDYPIEREGEGAEPSFDSSRGVFTIPSGVDGARRAMMEWYAGRAREHFSERTAAIYPLFGDGGAPPSRILITDTRTRLGSCKGGKDPTLRFHWILVTLPPEMGDGVVAHELTHLWFPNHSKKFYELLETVCPGYRELYRRICESVSESPFEKMPREF